MALYIFDKDGTLIKNSVRKALQTKKVTRAEEQVLLPGVYEKIQQLRKAGHVIALASNQKAVAEGIITPDQAQALLENVAEKIGGVAAIKFCGYSPKAPKELHGKPNPYARDDAWRKPHPGMLLALMQELGFSPADTVIVGNASDDQKAAQAAGVTYYPAKDFFSFEEEKAPARQH